MPVERKRRPLPKAVERKRREFYQASVERKRRPPVQWQGVFERWSKNFVRKMFWRVRPYVDDKEDCLQYCALEFQKCLRTYENVRDPKHIMALYQTMVIRRFLRLAQLNTRENTARENVNLQMQMHGKQLITPPEQTAANTYYSMPDEVQAVVNVLADASAETVRWLLGVDTDDTTHNGLRLAQERTIEKRLRQAAGINDPDFNPLAELRRLLT